MSPATFADLSIETPTVPSPLRHDAAHLAAGILLGATGTLALCATVAGIYLVKSALGINLMAGPSPLHDLLYHLVR